MFEVWIPFIVCVFGLLIWAVSSRSTPANPILVEGGKIAFAFGLLVTLYECAVHVFR